MLPPTSACAIRALLLELLPFLGGTSRPTSIVLGQEELHRKTLELLQLLPLNMLGLQVGARVALPSPGGGLSPHLLSPSPLAPHQPCQPLTHQSQDVVDKLLLYGLLEAKEVGVPPWGGGDRQGSLWRGGGNIKGVCVSPAPNRRVRAGSVTWPRGPPSRAAVTPSWTSATVRRRTRRSPSATSRYWGCPPHL